MWKSESMFRFGKSSTVVTLLSCSFFLVRDDVFQLLFLKQIKPSYLLVTVSALYPLTDSFTGAATDIITDDRQISISYPGLHWHATSLPTPRAYQYRLTLQPPVWKQRLLPLDMLICVQHIYINITGRFVTAQNCGYYVLVQNKKFWISYPP